MVEEMRYALKKMNEEKDERKKLYYFSGTYGVISRVFNFESDIRNSNHEKILWALTEAVVPIENQGNTVWTHNQAIMELGALVCIIGKPKCLLCPLKGHFEHKLHSYICKQI